MTAHDPFSPLPSPPTGNTSRRHRALGLPVIALIGLALLAVPRVVLHDLGLIQERTFANIVLVFVPPLIWIGVVLLRRVRTPFLTLLVVGSFYGLFLAIGHQLLWDVAWGDTPPTLGGNLADLDPAVQSAILRFFAAVSSLFTGVIVGAVAGLIAWGLGKATRRTPA